MEFRPSPVFLLVSAAVSLMTPLEPTAGTAMSVVLMAFRGGRLGLVSLKRCSWTNKAYPRRVASITTTGVCSFYFPDSSFCSACPYPPFCPPLWISAGLPRSQREPETVCSPMSCLLSGSRLVCEKSCFSQGTWTKPPGFLYCRTSWSLALRGLAGSFSQMYDVLNPRES